MASGSVWRRLKLGLIGAFCIMMMPLLVVVVRASTSGFTGQMATRPARVRSGSWTCWHEFKDRKLERTVKVLACTCGVLLLENRWIRVSFCSCTIGWGNCFCWLSFHHCCQSWNRSCGILNFIWLMISALRKLEPTHFQQQLHAYDWWRAVWKVGAWQELWRFRPWLLMLSMSRWATQFVGVQEHIDSDCEYLNVSTKVKGRWIGSNRWWQLKYLFLFLEVASEVLSFKGCSNTALALSTKNACLAFWF